MVASRFRLLFALGVLISLASGAYFLSENGNQRASDKIQGANLESPPQPIIQAQMDELAEIGVEWVAVIPYGFTPREEATVVFDHPHQWWGEGLDGATELVKMAHQSSLSVMLKPQVWVRGIWVGDYAAKDEGAWKDWERGYEAYILAYASMADSLGVEAFCIGTEYRLAVAARKPFWLKLIARIREVYDGKLTYSANWDDYTEVHFWEELDYIGISAYFPISELDNPTDQDLNAGWEPHITAMERFAQAKDMPILFTEYGYRSGAKAMEKPWESKGGEVDLSLQSRAYNALYRNVWGQPWFAGGFFWKWQFRPAAGGPENNDFTPQGKPAMEAIRRQYAQ